MGVPPAYFLDEMEPYELSSILTEQEAQYKDTWERTRMVVHAVRQGYSDKVLEARDVIEFPWDKKRVVEVDPNALTKEELEVYAKSMEDMLNGKTNNDNKIDNG